MGRRKNVKRIDPRYFLNETVNRNDDGSRLEEDLDEVLEEEELEEGWDDIKAAAGKAWKKVKGGAEDAWDAVATTADDIRWSPKDLGASVRRRRKAKKAAEREADREWNAKRDAQLAARDQEYKAKMKDYHDDLNFRKKHGMSRKEYEARERRDKERRYRDSMRLTPDEKRRARQERDAKFKSKQYDKDQERMGYKDKRVGNVGYVGSGGVGSSKRYNEE